MIQLYDMSLLDIKDIMIILSKSVFYIMLDDFM